MRLGLIHGGFVPHRLHSKHHAMTHGKGFEKRTEEEFASMSLDDGQSGHGIKKKRHLKPLTFRR